jgi:lambda family phage portal protein
MRLDTETFRAGVEMDAVGAPIADHIRSQHPGDDILAFSRRWTWERVPRETDWGRPLVVHAFEPGRAGQVRGVPPLSPILKKLKNLTRYDEAELQAALLNAVLAAFVTSPFDHEALADSLGDKLSDYQEARLAYYAERPLRMPGVQVGFSYPGEQVTLTQPQHPNAGFEGFSRVALRNVAAAAGITYEQMTMDWSQVNYSSARAALLEVWRGLTARKDNFAAQFMQPWYAAWLEERIETGAIELPAGAPTFRERRAAYCRAEWIGPGRGWIDPQKEADAAVTRIDGGLSTLQRECAEQGLDWREVLAQRARERREATRLGLDPSQSLRPTLTRDAGPTEE